MHYEGAAKAKVGKHAGEDLRERGMEDAEKLGRSAGGVCQRAQDVEDRADADLAADRGDVLHRGVKRLSEEKAHADLIDHLSDARGRHLQVDPQRLQDVGAPAR